MSTKKYAPASDKYKNDVVPRGKEIQLCTVMQRPKLEKICLNRGVNGAVLIRNWLISRG